MSSLTECNYCVSQRILRRLKAEGKIAKVVSSKKMSGWKTVRVYNQKKEYGLFMEVSNNCCC